MFFQYLCSLAPRGKQTRHFDPQLYLLIYHNFHITFYHILKRDRYVIFYLLELNNLIQQRPALWRSFKDLLFFCRLVNFTTATHLLNSFFRTFDFGAVKKKKNEVTTIQIYKNPHGLKCWYEVFTIWILLSVEGFQHFYSFFRSITGYALKKLNMLLKNAS